MGSSGPERSAVQPAPPGEAVGPLARVEFPHTKDGVALVSARVLLWHGRAPHACGLVPPASVSGALCVASVEWPARVGCACAQPLVPFVALASRFALLARWACRCLLRRSCTLSRT